MEHEIREIILLRAHIPNAGSSGRSSAHRGKVKTRGPPSSWEDADNTSTSNAQKGPRGTPLTHILKPELLIAIQPP